MKKFTVILVCILGVCMHIHGQEPWKRVNAGSIESGITGDPTLRYTKATGFGIGGDDVMSVSNEAVWRLNNNSTGTATVLTTFPTGVPGGSKVNGKPLLCPDGKWRIYGYFPVSPTQIYGIMVSDASNPSSFSVQTNSLLGLNAPTATAQRGIVACDWIFVGEQLQLAMYGGDVTSINGTATPTRIAFLNVFSGIVTSIPITLTAEVGTPVTNPRLRFISRSATNSNQLFLGGATVAPFRGAGIYDVVSATVVADFNIINSGAPSQAVTSYFFDSFTGSEYFTWKSDNLLTNTGINSPGLLKISGSSVLGVSGGAPNLQGNSMCKVGAGLFIGGSRYAPANPANAYYFSGSTYTDTSGLTSNNLDANGLETLYDLETTPNFVYTTGNFQVALGDIANFIAVQNKIAVVLAINGVQLSGTLNGGIAKLTANVDVNEQVNVYFEKSEDGRSFQTFDMKSINAKSYLNVSSSLPSGGYYFRVKVVSTTNGNIKYSNIIFLKVKSNVDISYLANTKGLYISGNSSQAVVLVYSSSGALVFKRQLNGENNVKLPTLSRGIYIAELTTEYTKVVKEIFVE